MLKIDGAAADKIGNAQTRKITETYALENNYRVKVVTWHDKARKGYLTSVSECIIETRDGWTWERHAMFADYSKIVRGEAVARYSWGNMERAHNIGADMAETIIRELLAAGANREIEAA